MKQLFLPKLLFLAAGALSLCTPLAAQNIDSPGDLIFTGYSADFQGGATPTNYRGFSLLALDNWVAGQTITVTDNAWTGTTLENGEFAFTFTPDITIPAGTTISFLNWNASLVAPNNVAAGTSKSYNINGGFVHGLANPVRIEDANTHTLITGSYTITNTASTGTGTVPFVTTAGSGAFDGLYVFLGAYPTAAAVPPFNIVPTGAFITAMATGGFTYTGVGTPGVLTGTGLTAGATALQLPSSNNGSAVDGQDVAIYNGTLACDFQPVGTPTSCATLLTNPGSWHTENSTGNDNTDADANFPTALQTSFINTFPVEWLSFSAEAVAGSVVLDWATASETNNAYFAVEHSFDNNTYQEVGTVAGKGTTQEVSTYSFEHATPAFGTNFYRIRQVDANGQTSYSEIRQVEVGRMDQFVGSVVPNPAMNGQMVSMNLYSLENAPAVVKVADVAGRTVLEQTFSLEKGMNNVSIPTDQFAAGIYLVRVRMNGVTYDAQRMVVQ